MTKARANFIIKDAESNQEKIEKTEKIKTNDFGFVSGKSYLNNDRSQNYLIFQLIFVSCRVLGWKPNETSN